MPPDCNSLQLIEEKIGFCKINCRWGKSSRGAPRKKERKPRPKKVFVKINNPRNICLTLEKEHLDWLQMQALHRSIAQGKPVNVNQLIRDVLNESVPRPKQMDMFGERNLI